jgi:hypothetical protein
LWWVITWARDSVATPFWKSVRMTLTLLKWGLGESFWTPENSEFNCRGQNTLHWCVLYTIGKVLKCRCRKWPCMSHSDIFSTSYGWKKGLKVKLAIWFPTTKSRELTQPRYVQVECHTLLESSQGELQVCFRSHPN